MMKTNYSNKKTSKRSRRVFAIVGFLVVIIGVVAILELTNTTHFFHKEKAVSSTITYAKPVQTTQPNSSTKTTAPVSTQNQTDNATTNNDGGTKTTTPTSPSTAALVAPYGTFVSNHSPGKDGSPTTENSVCLTTPGASCYITFTDQGVVKTLAVGTANGNGAVYWNNWDVNSAGFTTGSWQIEAIATLNGQTKSTQDSIPLVIQ